jgi:NAD(P)H dehydrogenase (quinone)
MAKKILIIYGHPNKESFNFSLGEAYRKGVSETKADIQEIVISDLNFNPNLQFGYQKIQALEPDLLTALDKIRWAEHIVWVHPVWWGGFPAIMKGFIDRLFVPTIAFKYRPNSVWWDKLFTGRSARIITTLDQPSWYYWLFYGRPSVNQLKNSILQFCGITPVRVSYVGTVRNSTDRQREKWLNEMYELGKKWN